MIVAWRSIRLYADILLFSFKAEMVGMSYFSLSATDHKSSTTRPEIITIDESSELAAVKQPLEVPESEPAGGEGAREGGGWGVGGAGVSATPWDTTGVEVDTFAMGILNQVRKQN